jgi:hypothetical protein
MFARDGCAVLCDLGVGRVLASAPGSTTRFGDQAGTYIYMAPELLANDKLVPTLRSDVYAYGLLLWCLFSGRQHAWMDAEGGLPSTLGYIIPAVVRGERPDVTALRPDTPPAVISLMQRCWAHDPTLRPPALTLAQETCAWVRGVDPVEARRAWLGVAAAAAKARPPRIHPSACSHAKAPKGAVWRAADAGDTLGLLAALGPKKRGWLGSTGGGSTEEADEVRNKAEKARQHSVRRTQAYACHLPLRLRAGGSHCPHSCSRQGAHGRSPAPSGDRRRFGSEGGGARARVSPRRLSPRVVF